MSDGSFVYPPLEQEEAEKIDGKLLHSAPILLRTFLFDSKTNRTFAPYEGNADDLDDSSLYFEIGEIESIQQPHINILVDRASMSMHMRLSIGSGDTNGKIILNFCT